MENDILTSLLNLEREIMSDRFLRRKISMMEWGGADVSISKCLDEDTKKWLQDQPFLVISPQNSVPRRRAVITEFSEELSWLFHRLRIIFSGRIDYISKYDFYGSLAQSAIDYLEKNKESKDMRPLLLAVVNTAKGLLDE
ncbi:MAG: hypothetical protein AB1499_06475 [Nitrospirota bacterium]